MGFLVRDFHHFAPEGFPGTVRRIRRGAATAFVDRATGELIAGYSYNTCMLAMFADDSVVGGRRLYVNLTKFGPTTAKHVGWLYGYIPSGHKPTNTWWTPAWVAVPCADAYAGRGGSADYLRDACHRQPTVADCVARKRREVDSHNARVDRELAERCTPVEIPGIGTAVSVRCDGQLSLADAGALADEYRAQRK